MGYRWPRLKLKSRPRKRLEKSAPPESVSKKNVGKVSSCNVLYLAKKMWKSHGKKVEVNWRQLRKRNLQDTLWKRSFQNKIKLSSSWKLWKLTLPILAFTN